MSNTNKDKPTYPLFFFQMTPCVMICTLVFLIVVAIFSMSISILVPSRTRESFAFYNQTIVAQNRPNTIAFPTLKIGPFQVIHQELRLFVRAESIQVTNGSDYDIYEPFEANLEFTVNEYDESEQMSYVVETVNKMYEFKKWDKHHKGWTRYVGLFTYRPLYGDYYIFNFTLNNLTQSVKSLQFKVQYTDAVRALSECDLRLAFGIISCFLAMVFMFVLRGTLFISWHLSQRLTFGMLVITGVCINPTLGFEYLVPTVIAPFYFYLVYCIYVTCFLLYLFILFDCIVGETIRWKTITETVISVCVGAILCMQRVSRTATKDVDLTTDFQVQFHIADLFLVLEVLSVGLYVLLFLLDLVYFFVVNKASKNLRRDFYFGMVLFSMALLFIISSVIGLIVDSNFNIVSLFVGTVSQSAITIYVCGIFVLSPPSVDTHPLPPRVPDTYSELDSKLHSENSTIELTQQSGTHIEDDSPIQL
ncbi:hypothetical protein EIN_468290 [Entamoeba invadens IP1]|uniref:Wntless-like transmembrane domain-containing protein n=1 Tax=Entamoeba invadens IP1 TaxID=370355 RepID=A0A0A1TUI2_ENTIV|nr:hypothetical protein EIN_468290 [Entamoeba invadens IP1]ELP83695.1 hypothetical protein EIN_468290 [Entamoeba invadens IP1]|eukprot:XP_004183041.1 hypothetical protein EIN_468290 [Entamoeba invadens IP1]